MNRAKVLSIVLSTALCITLGPTIAKGDDVFPVPWPRAHPNAITVEWEFETPADPSPPTPGPLTNVGVKGGGSVATLADIVGPAGWGAAGPPPSFGDGGWFFPGAGSIDFTVDNVIDLEPVKFIQLQVTHSPGMGLAIDAMAAANFGATGSTPGPVSPPIPLGDGIHTMFTWSMAPNPPFEFFSLLITGPGEIDEIVLDTISIPEPSMLGAIGLLTVGFAIRRRHRVA